MPAAPISVTRTLAREALAAFLKAALVPDPVYAVFAYPLKDAKGFYPEGVYLRGVETQGIFPVITVASRGSNRQRKFIGQGKFSAEFIIDVETFVPWIDDSMTPPWTEKQAENKLDELEAYIADALSNSANVHAGGFDIIQYDADTEARKVEMEDGTIYRNEVIKLRLKMLHG